MAGGGHLPPLVLRASGEVEAVPLRGMLIGVVPDPRVGEVTVRLAPGETCLLYSDGVTEARGGRRGDEQFGAERLVTAVTGCHRMPAPALAERIEQVTCDWLAQGDHDDIAVLALRATGPGGATPRVTCTRCRPGPTPTQEGSRRVTATTIAADPAARLRRLPGLSWRRPTSTPRSTLAHRACSTPGVPAERVLLDLVAPAQAEVGERWARNEWSVAQEHAATHISERVVAAVAAYANPRPDPAAGSWSPAWTASGTRCRPGWWPRCCGCAAGR